MIICRNFFFLGGGGRIQFKKFRLCAIMLYFNMVVYNITEGLMYFFVSNPHLKD